MPILEIKKPLAIVLDVTGPLVTKSFMTYSSETRQFLLNNYKDYVREVWGRTNLKLSVNFFRKEMESERDESRYPPLAPISAPQEEQINAFLEHLKYRFEHAWGVRSAALGIFHLGLSEWAYKKGLLLTPVYPEVKDVLTQWKMVDGLKVYVNVGPTNFLRNVFSRTTQGNLLPLIDGHMNLLEHKSKNFIKLIQLLEMNPQDIVFITRMVEDAKLASKEKIRVVIIVREDFAPDTVAEIKGTQKAQKSSKEREKQREEKRAKKRQMHLAKSRISATEFGGEEKHISSDYETVTSGFDDEDYEPSASSIGNTDDIRDFPVIVKLDDLKWLP